MQLSSYQGDKPYVFISYSHRDTDRVYRILEHMTEAGYRYWYDEGIDPGTEWDENIASHISNAAYMIAFVSQNYLGSQNCKDEIAFARELDKNQILIYLEDAVLPDGLRMRLNRIQAIHWYRYQDPERAMAKLRLTSGIEPCIEDGGAHAAQEEKTPSASTEQKQPEQKTNGGKARSKRWIPILAAGVLLAAAVLLILLLTGRSEAEPAESAPPEQTTQQQMTQPQTEQPEQTTEPAEQSREPAFRHVTLYAPEECPISTYETCLQILQERLELLTQYDGSYRSSDSNFTIDLDLPEKSFGERPTAEIVRAFVTRPGRFYLGTQSCAKEDFLALTPQDIAEASAGNQIGMMASGIDMSDTSPLQYVKLILKKEYAEANAEALAAFGKDLILAQDVNLDPYIYHTAELSEDGRTVVVAMSERGPQFPELLVHMLKTKPMEYGFTFLIRLDPVWETVPDREAPGELQVNVEDIEGPAVTLLYVPAVKEISSGNWLDTRILMKKRLDAAGIPYSFGTTDSDYQIAVRLSMEQIGPVWIHTICANSGKLRLYVGLDILDVSCSPDLFQIRKDGDSLSVELHLPEKTALALQNLVSVSGPQIRLGFNEDTVWLQADAADLDGTVLRFTQMAAGKTVRPLTAEDGKTLELIEHVLSGEQLPVSYSCTQQAFVPGPDGRTPSDEDYGIPLSASFAEAEDRIREALPEAEVYHRDNRLLVQLDLARNEDFPVRAAEMAIRAYEASDLMNTAAKSLMVVCVREKDQIGERSRIQFSKSYFFYSDYYAEQWPEHYTPGRIAVSAALIGPDMEPYIEPLRHAIEENEAYQELLSMEDLYIYSD